MAADNTAPDQTANPPLPPGAARSSGGGVAGSHPEDVTQPVLAAPTTTSDNNFFSLEVTPVACWRVDDVRFAFDSSFVRPEVADEITRLKNLRDQHKKSIAPSAGADPVDVYPPLSVFGHADPVGDDTLNKTLTGRRAMAVYGMLTRDTSMWNTLYSSPAVGDDWNAAGAKQSMLDFTGLSDDGDMTSLIQAYMDAVCGKDFVLDKQQDFLAGTDPDGKGDYQGCSRFNPVLIFSKQETDQYAQTSDHTQRDEENAPNRRVMVLLFRPGTTITASKWPCPRAKEPYSGCVKRFWSDGDNRRFTQLQNDRRLFESTADTFACRFYQRLTDDSPCEKARKNVWIDLESVDEFGHRVPNFDLILFLPDGSKRQTRTDSTGYRRELNVPQGELKVTLKDGTTQVHYLLNGQETDAVLHTDFAAFTVTMLVVVHNATPEQREQMQQLDQLHSRPDGGSDTVTGRVATADPNTEEPNEDEQQTPAVRSYGVAVDNLTLVAGLNRSDNTVNMDAFFSELSTWLSDYHPSAKGRGYFVQVLKDKTIQTYSSDGSSLGGPYDLCATPAMRLGAYTVFEETNSLAFVDMASESFGASTKEELPTDENGLAPLSEIVAESQRADFEALREGQFPKVEILYRMPDPGQLVTVATVGGVGVLENYGADSGVNAHIHHRNVAVASFVSTIYTFGVLEKYIDQVNAAKSEDDIRKLGPPANPYIFPIPAGASDSQAGDIASANHASSLRAWEAIAAKLDKLANQHAEGALFLRVKVKLKPFEQKNAFTNLVPYISEIAVEDNLDVGSDGILTKGPVVQGSLTSGLTENAAKSIPMGGSSTVGLKQEVNVISGKKKTTVSIDLKVVKIEVANDGTRKITLASGASSEINPETGEFGGGYKFGLDKLFGEKAKGKGEIYIGLGFQGVRQDTLISFFSEVPGFFERRSVDELLSAKTQWNDLKSDEHARLEVLGWNHDTWDKKRLLPIDAFPQSAQEDFSDLTPNEQVALVGLGIRQYQQPGVWSKIAKQ
jgi:hypothetical protein